MKKVKIRVFLLRQKIITLSTTTFVLPTYATKECQVANFHGQTSDIFGKQMEYIFQSPKTIKTWTTKHYASLNQWWNNKCIFTKLNAVFILKTAAWTKKITTMHSHETKGMDRCAEYFWATNKFNIFNNFQLF